MNIGFLLIYCEGINTIHYWNSKQSNRISSQPGFGDYQLSKKPCSINDKRGNMKKNTSKLGITARYNVRDNRFTRSQADGLLFLFGRVFFWYSRLITIYSDHWDGVSISETIPETGWWFFFLLFHKHLEWYQQWIRLRNCQAAQGRRCQQPQWLICVFWGWWLTHPRIDLSLGPIL